MRSWRRSRFFVADLVLIAIVAAVILAFARAGSRSSRSRAMRRIEATVLSEPLGGGRSVPPGFLGLSLEYPALESYAGDDPNALNPLFERLVRNLSPGQAPVIRIGGDSADWTWWPVPAVARPPGVTYTLSTRWLQVARAVTYSLHARLILGLNFEADKPALANAEARALTHGFGRGVIQSLELGNEPELYAVFPWYRRSHGRKVTGRPPTYDFNSFLRDFTGFAHALPPIPLAGPTISGPAWMGRLNELLAAEPTIRVVTLHRYPLQLCFARPRSPRYPTIAHLLSPTASSGLAASFKPYVAIAHARGLPLRIDELNTVSCGADRAVSVTFAAALWALDALFEMARVGVDGVNIHTFPGAGYELFNFSRVHGKWQASVAPEYYGLLMFAQAVPPGSRLLRISSRHARSLKLWATRAPDGRIRVVLINKDTSRPLDVALRVPSAGIGTLERLRAPRLAASANVTIGGQSFASRSDRGLLPDPPQTNLLKPADGSFVVSMPAASAALLTLPPAPASAAAKRRVAAVSPGGSTHDPRMTEGEPSWLRPHAQTVWPRSNGDPGA